MAGNNSAGVFPGAPNAIDCALRTSARIWRARPALPAASSSAASFAHQSSIACFLLSAVPGFASANNGAAASKERLEITSPPPHLPAWTAHKAAPHQETDCGLVSLLLFPDQSESRPGNAQSCCRPPPDRTFEPRPYPSLSAG